MSVITRCFGFVKRKFFHIALLAVGVGFMIAGVIGMFLPIIPGMIFFLLGLGISIRVVPFLVVLFKIPPIKNAMRRKISLKTKIYVIVSLWLSYVVFQVLLIYFQHDFSFQVFFSKIKKEPAELVSFVVPAILLFFISIYILYVKNIFQLIGYREYQER